MRNTIREDIEFRILGEGGFYQARKDNLPYSKRKICGIDRNYFTFAAIK